MSIYYPIFLNIQGRKCVVVGGGEVAERKARALADQGASVTVISARVCDGLAQLAEQSTKHDGTCQGNQHWIRQHGLYR